jgi:hypothetical protein
MGVEMPNIPVRLDEDTIAQIDALMAELEPMYIEGRGTFLRALIKHSLTLISEGSMRFDFAEIQRVHRLRSARMRKKTRQS